MKRLRLIVDMDDVLGDFTGQLIKYYQYDFGINIERKTLNGHHDIDGFPPEHHVQIRKFPYRPNFFRTLPVIKDSRDVMEQLNQRYEVFVVSSATKLPHSITEKIDWLGVNFPFLSWDQLVFCGSKSVVHGDLMIDDNDFNLKNFSGHKFFFTAPHNFHLSHYPRFDNWQEVAQFFL